MLSLISSLVGGAEAQGGWMRGGWMRGGWEGGRWIKRGLINPPYEFMMTGISLIYSDRATFYNINDDNYFHDQFRTDTATGGWGRRHRLGRETKVIGKEQIR